MPEKKRVFILVRAGGAIICILTLNAIFLVSFLNPDVAAIDPGDEVPRWTVYMLMTLIGAFLGLDALLNVNPNTNEGPATARPTSSSTEEESSRDRDVANDRKAE